MRFISNVFPAKKFFKILTKEQKKEFYKIVLLLVFATILEVTGIGLLIPVMSIFTKEITNANILNITEIVKNIFNYFSIEVTIFSLLIFLSVFFLIKASYLTVMTYRQSKFFYKIESSIRKRIYQGYLDQSYNFFLTRSSSNLINNSINEVGNFNGNALQAMMILLSELMVIIGILSILMFIQLQETIILMVFISFFFTVWIKFSKKKIISLGLIKQEKMEKLIMQLQQGIFSIKEIKIMRKQNFFVNKFNFISDLIEIVNAKSTLLFQIPRLWIEFYAIFLIVLLISALMLLDLNFSQSEILPLIILYVIAAFRIIPCINRFTHAMQQINFASSSINKVYDELNLVNEPRISSKEKIFFKNKITLSEVSFFYNEKKKILEDLSFEIIKGEHVAILGPSGSGKTTLLNLMTGLIKPKKGLIKIDEIDIFQNLESWWSQLGYISQNIYLLDDTLLANIVFGDENIIDMNKINHLIKLCSLEDTLKSLPEGIMTNVGEKAKKLSGGQIQRLALARCLYSDPDVIFLDEATNALDLKTEIEIYKIIEKLKGKKTIINVSHRLLPGFKYDKILKVENHSCIIV